MATKKQKTEEIKLEDGMYFTAIMHGKKIRGYVKYVGFSNFLLCGKDFSEKACDNDAEGFPTHEETEATYASELKNIGIRNFVECKDKRQIAVIDKDKMPLFQNWRVKVEGNDLVFGCGAVTIPKKEAKIFAEILADCNDMNLVISYREIVNDRIGNYHLWDEIDEYYQMRKWLEDYWTEEQKRVFDRVCQLIEDEDSSYLGGLEPKEVKKFMSQF